LEAEDAKAHPMAGIFAESGCQTGRKRKGDLDVRVASHPLLQSRPTGYITNESIGLLDGFFQFTARFEFRDSSLGDLDLLSGLRISACAGCTTCDRKRSESHQRYLVAILKSHLDRVEHGVQGFSCDRLGDPGYFCHFSNQITLVHKTLLTPLFAYFPIETSFRVRLLCHSPSRLVKRKIG